MALQSCAIENMNTFMNNVFYIPNYQRDYAWEIDELTDFWSDLESTKDNNEEQVHFFGQIVVHNDEKTKRKYIIDGQQRTITSTIFMRALQLYYDQIYKNDGIPEAMHKVSDISSIHLGRHTKKKNELHLTLGELDNDYFKDNIELGTPESCVKGSKKSHERMRKAYQFFYDNIGKVLEGLSDPEDQVDALDEYYEAFINRFNVLYMEATKLDEAFVIFETLNARGKDLATADLLKNHIFSQSKDIDLAIKKWNSMVNSLDKTDPTKYIRHFWNSRKVFTREKALYRKISGELNSPKESKELLTDLEKYAIYYHDMTDPTDINGFSDAQLIHSLKAIKTLKASSFYPVVLAMLQAGFAEGDIREVVQLIETLIFRNFTIGGKVANSAEVFFSEVALKIYNQTYDTLDEIKSVISREIISDKEFQDAFEVWMASKSGKEIVRYILRKIHKYLDDANEINLDNTDVHIEHIMPEDASQWHIDDAIHEEYLWRLGNLALISGTYNKSMSNKPFDQKKPKYLQSKIEPNPAIASCEVWTEKEIENRQKRLTAYAMKIWLK